MPNRSLLAFGALSLTLSTSTFARAQTTATDAEVCRAAQRFYDTYTRHVAGCAKLQVASPEARQLNDCEAQVARCRAFTKAWFVRYLTGLSNSIEPAPMCSGDHAEWWRKEMQPRFENAARQVESIPIDENCGFAQPLMAFYRMGGASLDWYLRGRSVPKPAPKAEPAPRPAPEPSPAPRPASPPPANQIEDSRPYIFNSGAGPRRRFHISALGSLGGYGAFTYGVGGLVGIPISRSVLPFLNDALYFEGGARLGFINYSNGFQGSYLQLLAGVRWDFYFSDAWSVYTAARGTPTLSVNGFRANAFGVGGAVGVHWRFADALGLRVEADGSNYGTTATAGVTLFF